MAEPSVSRRKVAGLEAGNPYAGTRKSRTAKESAVSSNSASLRAPREEAVELDGRKQNHTCEPPPHTSQPRSTHLSIDTLARPVTSHSNLIQHPLFGLPPRTISSTAIFAARNRSTPMAVLVLLKPIRSTTPKCCRNWLPSQHRCCLMRHGPQDSLRERVGGRWAVHRVRVQSWAITGRQTRAEAWGRRRHHCPRHPRRRVGGSTGGSSAVLFLLRPGF